MWSDLHSRVHQVIRQRSLIPPHTRLLLAVSGGQDSLCLLRLGLDLQSRWGWSLAVAHCDHGWATDAGIADHVAAIASGYNLPIYHATAENLPETEAAARHWRYAALTALAEAHHYPYVLTGHTQSDRAETTLYHLIRGAGTDGLRSLPWQRPLSPTVTLVRPLLTVTRTETAQFCHTHHLPIWHDVANENLAYARNRLRHEIIPQLKTHFNPQIEQAIAHTAELLHAEVDYLEAQARQLYHQTYHPDPPRLHRPTLNEHHLALQRRVIRQFLAHHLPHASTFAQIEQVQALLTAPNGSRSSTLPGQWWAIVDRPWLLLQRVDS
ncbi:tRNA lysidine(34) synthetase TilS [Spirulina major]|uniref:tRNA lysidine(34) synthetase TilS n=1 Tax=Spirulina major TaxID=270636 RepID=UPI0009331927|nr:tRNA lysidine(34) synthetase TilS [Spirulina major]